MRNTPAFPGGIGAPSKHVRLTYDTTRHLIYFWGGDYCVSDAMFPGRCASHEELFSYDVATDRWQLVVSQKEAIAAGFPRGRCLPGMTYDPVHDVLWMTSGSERFDEYAPGLRSGGLWSFNLKTRKWTRQGPSPDGESKKVRAISTNVEDLVYDPVSRSLFTFTRDDPNGNDVAFFYPLSDINLADGRSKDNWSAHGLPALNDGTMGAYSFAVDTKRNRAIVYVPKFGETWAFDFSGRKMTRLVRQMLPAKSVFGMVYDSGNDVVVLYGGYNNYEGEPDTRPLDDLWVLDLTKNSWSKQTLTGKIPSPRKGESLVYDSANQALVQMGGTGGWQDGVDSSGYDGTEVFLLRLQLGGSPPHSPPPPTGSAGWTRQVGQTVKRVCPPDPSPPSEGCSAVVADWSGGIGDTKRNRLILWGGGHTGYYGNELYAFNLSNNTLVRLNNPSPPNLDRTRCVPELSDGTPNSRHTYGMAYIAHADKMFVFGGRPACDPGNESDDTWTLDLATLKWKRTDPVHGGHPQSADNAMDYDSNSKKVFISNYSELWSYTYDTNTYTLLNNSAALDHHAAGVIDPKRKLFFLLGGGSARVFHISTASSYAMQNLDGKLAGCDGIVNAVYPGLAYDSAHDRIVGWPNFGNTVYLLNPDTKSCTTQAFSGGPPDSDHQGTGRASTNGTHGRFRYFPGLNRYALVNQYDIEAYTLVLN